MTGSNKVQIDKYTLDKRPQTCSISSKAVSWFSTRRTFTSVVACRTAGFSRTVAGHAAFRTVLLCRTITCIDDLRTNVSVRTLTRVDAVRTAWIFRTDYSLRTCVGAGRTGLIFRADSFRTDTFPTCAV